MQSNTLSAVGVVRGDSVTCPAMKIVGEARALCRCGAVQQGLSFRREAVITHKLEIQTAYCVRTAVSVGRMIRKRWDLAS